MTNTTDLRQQIADKIGFKIAVDTPDSQVIDRVDEEGFARLHLRYKVCDGETINSYLLMPDNPGPHPGIVAFHQHNSQWQLGKSEVCGLAGDSYQAFAPELARRGVCVLAPDAAGFESRRETAGAGKGLAPNLDSRGSTSDGWLQYYNQMCYRLVKGDNLLRKDLSDASAAVSLLQSLENVDSSRIGAVGHSSGGITVMFLAALDSRVVYSCASGAACTYRAKMLHGTGLAMSLVVPGFAQDFDVDDLVCCIAPRRTLLVSSEDDPYTEDSREIVQSALGTFEEQDCVHHLRHFHGKGAHALDQSRYDAIIDWLHTESMRRLTTDR